MEYATVADARALPGVRLVLSIGVPGPWGESAKAVLHTKGIAYTAVAQLPTQPNEDLVAWTGHANAPVLVVGEEPARAGWAEILFAAEGLAADPSLLPAVAGDRAAMFGLAHEICGQDGLGWNRRLAMVHQGLAFLADAPAADRAPLEVLGSRYGYSPGAGERAEARTAEILEVLALQLAAARGGGGRYFFGDRLSALDLYWACFAAMVAPLPQDLCPMPRGMRAVYESRGPLIDAALDPALLEHRDFIYREHLVLPMDF
jgi:glutathione S-transferase